MKIDTIYIKNKLAENWKSGLTVALVSIPLSISLAIASGVSPIAGILTAVYAGAVAAIFGGSNYNIVGPAGALSGILSVFAITKGAQYIPMLALLAGIIIIILKVLKVEKYLIFIPESTIFGFTLGVAFTIASNQLNFALGLKGLEKHEHLLSNILESIKHLPQANLIAAVSFIAFLSLMFFLLKKTPKLPGAIPVSVIGILVGILSKTHVLPFAIDTLGDNYPTIKTAVNLPFVFKLDTEIIVASITIALVAILETMISAHIADGLTKTKHNKEKELFGLGLSNIISGLFGALPATAVFARTSINIKSGANSNMSALINTIFVLIISFFLLPLFKFIPMSAIAAILVFAAVRMIETHKLTQLYRLDKRSFCIGILVCVVTISVDAIYGILLGTLLSLMFFVEKMTHGHFTATAANDQGEIIHIRDTEETINSESLVYSIKGPLSYINGTTHLERFERGLNGYKKIFIRLKECSFIDIDGAEILDQIIELILADNREVILISNDPFINEQIVMLTKHAKKLKTFNKTSEAFASLN